MIAFLKMSRDIRTPDFAEMGANITENQSARERAAREAPTTNEGGVGVVVIPR